MTTTKIRGSWLRSLVHIRRRWRRFRRHWKKTTPPVPNIARRRLKQHAPMDTWA